MDKRHFIKLERRVRTCMELGHEGVGKGAGKKREGEGRETGTEGRKEGGYSLENRKSKYVVSSLVNEKKLITYYIR